MCECLKYCQFTFQMLQFYSKKYNNQENIQFKMLVYLQQYKILVKIIQMALTVNKHFRMYQHTIY